MNLLDKTEIQIKTKTDSKRKKNLSVLNEDKPNSESIKTDFKENNIYKNLIIVFIVLFSFFSVFVFISRSNIAFNNNDYSFINLISVISRTDHFTMQSIVSQNNKIKIIINVDNEKYIYNNLLDIENLYSNIKFRVNNGINQIWIEEYYTTSTKENLNEIFSIISSIDTLNVELEIINNKLILVGKSEDCIKVFSYFKKINYNNFQFDLKLIEYESVEKYYRLTI